MRARSSRPSASRRRTGPEGKRDKVVQFAQIEWLVPITDGPRDQRVDLCPGVLASSHHEDWRVHTVGANLLEQVKVDVRPLPC